jgi:hypothetical protein
MSTTTAPESSAVSPRLLFVGLWAVAALGYVALLLVDRPLAAAGAFVVIGAVAVGYGQAGDVRFDERDTDVYRAASARTVQALGIVSAVAFPALVAASALGYYEWTAFAAGVGATVTAVFLVWVGMLVLARAGR